MGSAATGGSLRAAGQSTSAPAGAVAALSHTAHSGAGVSAHAVTPASDHASLAHAGAAVGSSSSEPAYYALCFIQKT